MKLEIKLHEHRHMKSGLIWTLSYAVLLAKLFGPLVMGFMIGARARRRFMPVIGSAPADDDYAARRLWHERIWRGEARADNLAALIGFAAIIALYFLSEFCWVYGHQILREAHQIARSYKD